MFKSYITLLFFATLLTACAQNKQNILFNHNNLSYEGRILFNDDNAELIWPGTSVTIRFEGTNISATMMDLDTANYYNVILNDEIIGVINTDTVKTTYTLATNLPDGVHKLELFKRTEWDKGKTLFYGFDIAGKPKTHAPNPPKQRKMEFYGNSITCGYAVEDFSDKDSWFGYFQNNYVTYGAIAARHFNAQYHCIAKSGIGIMVSWFPFTMPEIYNRLDPTDENSLWNFEDFKPNVVVVNLFQNDSWIVEKPDHEEFIRVFGKIKPTEEFIIKAYKDFLETLRSKHPNADIICCLGNMDATREHSLWPGYVSEAVSQINDSKIHTLFFEYKNTPGHPRTEEQKAMAERLINYIETNIEW